jgi:hypothetical protein
MADFQPTWALIKKPVNYPTDPTVGKIQLIWQTNSKSLYHRFSPYTDYDIGLANKLIGDKEPFYYIYPDQNNQGLNALKKYESDTFPLGSAPIDVIRVSKFLVSGRGVTFLAKQFLLQTGNAYNETRIYNPSSPIVAAGMSLALGTVRPNRAFDTSAGIAGIATTLLGSLGSSIFGKSAINPPSGTTGVGALPTSLIKSGGKGLLRAGTANAAKSTLDSAWGQPKTSKGFFSSVFANFIPETQDGITYRSDEGAYGLMVGAGNNKFIWIGRDGSIFGSGYGFGQRWIAGGVISRKNDEYPTNTYRVFNNANGTPSFILSTDISDQTLDLGNGDSVTIGYDINESTIKNSPGFRYEDAIGADVDSNFESSDVMVQYSTYAQTKNQFPTKQTDATAISNTNTSLNEVLTAIKNASGGLYNLSVPADARVISSNIQTKSGYDRLFATNKRFSNPMNYPLGLLQDYRNQRVVDNSLTTNVKSSKKLSGAGNFDAINTLQVLDKDMKIKNSKLKGWTDWKPYEDDQIAFYFYDVVNEKYIPFRAAITGLSEASNASWEEMPFIGRADKVYSYGGFNRNLSLNIKIVISSIAELAPTWQRINYLTTLVKPANYTTSTYNGVMNRFMIPPMVMMTLGDMYKDQPVLIQFVITAVPDDAIWETQNEFNSKQWEYLAGYLTSPNAVYGQLPRTVDIALGLILLEKERAIVGGANFGHAPRTENFTYWNTKSVPNGGSPNKLHQSLVVPQDRSNGTAIYSKDTVNSISEQFQ